MEIEMEADELTLWLSTPVWFAARRTITAAFSFSLRNQALAGESGSAKKTTAPVRMVTAP